MRRDREENIILKERLRIISNMSRITAKELEPEKLLNSFEIGDICTKEKALEVIDVMLKDLEEDDADKLVKAIDVYVKANVDSATKIMNETMDSMRHSLKSIHRAFEEPLEKEEVYVSGKNFVVSGGNFIPVPNPNEDPEIITSEMIKNDMKK